MSRRGDHCKSPQDRRTAVSLLAWQRACRARGVILTPLPPAGWSRGALLDVTDGTASVWLVDSGRLAEVPAAQLRMIHPDLTAYPACAVEITLAGQ